MGVLNPHSRGGVPGSPAGRRGRGGVGTVVAVIVGLCFVGLIGTLVLRARLAGPKFAGAETVPPPAPVPMPTDSGRVVGYNIELADKNDPTRVAFRLEAEAADPAGNRRYRLTKPEAWAYLEDGNAVHVRSDMGQVYVPIENQPESGTITGNVVVTLYAPGKDGKPDTSAPLGVFKTKSLTFDTNTLEISTLDAFTIESEQLRARGEGIKALFNEVRQRVEYLQITRGSSVTFTPRVAEPAPVAAARPPAGRPAPGAAPATAKPAADVASTAVETLYQLVLNDEVRVIQPGRTLNADRLDAWFRLLDNQLPPDAIASLKAGPAPAAARPTGGKAGPPQAPAQRTASAEPSGGAQDGPITISWSGPCVLRPLESPTTELGTDHAFLRATAEKTGLVTFRDEEAGGGGQCAALEYGLTTAILTLSGPGPTSVALSLDDGWSLETARAAFDLRKLSGLVPGPGVIKGAPGTQDEASQITWASRTVIALARAAGGGRRAVLRQTDFLGRVFATDGRASIRGESVRAEFTADAQGRARLSRVVAEDKNRVIAQSDEDRRLTAEYVELGFKPGESVRRPEPAMLIARGRVEARDRGADLTGSTLEAELEQDERGKTAVRRATVRDLTFARAEDDVKAAGDQAVVDARKQTVDLTGAGAFVASGLTRVAGPQISINGEARTIAVFGAWTIDQGEPGPDGRAPSHAQGTSGLTFDDRTGKAEGAGDVRVVHRPDDLTTDSMNAERVLLQFTPRPDAPPAGSDARPRPLDRKLVRAEAIGGVLEREGGANATVESRRYAIDPSGGDPARKLIQLLYAEGPRLIADDAAGTLEVPAAGVLVLRDHEPPAPGADPGSSGSDFRGDTRFDWDGTMRFDRAAGSVEMDRNVRVTHLRLADKQAVTLVAEHVSARGKARERRDGESTASAPDRFDLTAATARGAVYVAVGPWTDPPTPPSREMAADLIDYDAATGVLLATASPGNLVTVFDSTRATPASAERVTWNVGTGRIELHRAQPVVIPR